MEVTAPLFTKRAEPLGAAADEPSNRGAKFEDESGKTFADSVAAEKNIRKGIINLSRGKAKTPSEYYHIFLLNNIYRFERKLGQNNLRKLTF